ncbi:MAG: phenylalanine--tRNA ligase subunit beta [Candidatus Beckwithbacteria bacterium]
MNLKFTHSWLSDFLSTDASPKQIAECLSLCGPSVEKLTQIKNDYLYELEVTTNRIDMMSVFGIAREAMAILPQFGFKAKLFLPELAKLNSLKKSLPIKIIDKQSACRRILAIVLDNVSVKPSSPKIKARLEAAGIRSLNNLVDVTNYVMTEIGHPTHVFDYDRLQTKTLVLRYSQKGEKITSLENKTYALPGDDIVIDDGTGRIIDLPGIIGTSNSVVTDSTKRILFFLETNDAVKIRRTSMNLGIRTLAATYNEKWVDPETALTALKRGIHLFQTLANARIASSIIDLYPQPIKPKSVSVSQQLISNRLGIDLTSIQIINILNSLGFEVNCQPKTKLYLIKVPANREKDINLPEDIIEEVARIYGYHRLPSFIMPTAIPTNYPATDFNLEYQLKTWLAGIGLNELYTNSLISETLALQSGYKLSQHLKIKNALSTDWLYLRRSLIPSHQQALNSHQPTDFLGFFEIANIYQPQTNKLPLETLQLIISSNKSYSVLKGILDFLFNKLHLEVEFKPEGEKALIYYRLILLGSVNQEAAVLNLEPLLASANIYPTYKPVSDFPPIFEDLTFTLPLKTYLGSVIKAIKSVHSLIKTVNLNQIYHQNFTFNLTYQSLVKPLTDQKISPIRQKIVTLLSKQFKAKLVGKI